MLDSPLLDTINGILWGSWTPFVLLAAGALFTVWTRCIQWTALTHGVQVVRGIYDDPDDPGAINHFQALSAALSATVGLGNIGGVALAIGIGGPGALFWIWVVGALGMALKSVEITLAMLYRNTDDPENPHGGAMWVVDRVLGSKGGVWKWVAKTIGSFFCVTLIIASFTSGNMFQAWNVAELTESYFTVPKLATGLVIAALVGLVIIGGIKRIGNVAAMLAPGMCLLYLISAFVVLAMHVTEIPGMLGLIFESAFQPTEATGAFIGGSAGWAFIQGMKRAFFSNEAGQGSAPIAHAAAKTDEPAREGIVGGIGPFIDTICICTVTGLVIISTGTWNREPVGAMEDPISLQVAASDSEESGTTTWEVVSSEVVSLPEDPYSAWTVGSQFFLIGDVSGGARHRETGSSKLKIVGQVSSISNETSATIQWSAVTEDPADWDGALTSIALPDQNIYREYAGAELTGHAFDREFPGLGRWLVTLASWLFALSSMISWSYYGEQGVVYLLGQRCVLPYKLLFLVGAVFAAVAIESADQMIKLMDLGTGAMLWANIPIVLVLGYLAVRSLEDYRSRLLTGHISRSDKDDSESERTS